MPYEHRQLGTPMLVGVGLCALLGGVLWFAAPELRPASAMLGAVAALLLCFSTLTTRVREGRLECAFGPGLIRRSIPLPEIRSIAVVRNPWYSGYGIRIGPRGVLWNVAGRDAVELELVSGKVFRIGTDEPAELARALEQGTGAGRVG